MCVLFIALNQHKKYPLIIVSNRDEYYARPTRPAKFWKDELPQFDLLAGKDLKSGGTWFGITKTGRIGLLTNFRAPKEVREEAPSRGHLVLDYLLTRNSAQEYLKELAKNEKEYNGFNLICGTPDSLFYYSNREGKVKELTSGFFGLSNHLLNTPWPKVSKGVSRFKELIQNEDSLNYECFFKLMGDETKAPDELLPDTGIGLEVERLLSSIFIRSEIYGTRTTSILFLERSKQVQFLERTYHLNKIQTVSYEFPLHLQEGNPLS